ncbi:MAG: hypothetical protein COY40_04930 [Alphaproteobacteria bacterium CG_4_10_14_0_8_um_filter_53_9]|nr:MAG: hypothetical protein COY40_04930 [Alphaproteobacteria bacterium CG_4_10_14_0_8_um_filter_53_9]
MELATTPGRKVILQNENADSPREIELITEKEKIKEELGAPFASDVIAIKKEETAPVLSTQTIIESLRAKVKEQGAILWGADEVTEFITEEDEAGTTLQGVRVKSGEVALADETFVAAGAITGLLLKTLHLTLPLRPSRQHLITFSGVKNFSEALITHRLRRGHLVFKGLMGGKVMLSYDGLMDPMQATYSLQVDETVLDLLHTYTSANLFPEFRDAKVEGAVCITGAVTPDFRPVVGRWRGIQGLWLATGFAGRSYAYAMGIAQTLGAIMTGAMPNLNLAPFAPERFELDRWPRFQRPPSLAWSEQATFAGKAQFATQVNTTGSGPAGYMDNVNMVDKNKVDRGQMKTTDFKENTKGKIQMAGTKRKG